MVTSNRSNDITCWSYNLLKRISLNELASNSKVSPGTRPGSRPTGYTATVFTRIIFTVRKQKPTAVSERYSPAAETGGQSVHAVGKR